MKILNPKIFVGIAVIVLAGAIGVIFTSTSITETSNDGTLQEIKSPVDPITIELEEVSILQVTERSAVIEIKFNLDNPNSRSVIANLLSYSLYGSDGIDEYKIASSEIGKRPDGMVDGSNYYTLLSNNSIVLKDKITLKNPGNSEELMSILESEDPKWRIAGTVFYNLSSMTSGQENEVDFELTY